MNTRYGSFEMARMRISRKKQAVSRLTSPVSVVYLSLIIYRERVAKAVFGPGPGPDSPRSLDLPYLQLLNYRGRFSVALAVKVNFSA